jgi:hypothetical protein
MIDPKKTYRTRDGREVRIYAVDCGSRKPVHGATSRDGKTWTQEDWSASGQWAPDDYATTPMDLIEVRPRINREVWVNVYRTATVYGICQDKGTADATASEARIACVKLVIDCEEGHGLD